MQNDVRTDDGRATMLPLRIASVVDLADNVRLFELVRTDGADLPAFTPGSHVTVQVPAGSLRKYSLCNDPCERYRYLIAVKREANGRGGSVSLFDEARAGGTLPTSVPDNAFPLVDKAPGYLFIAGGIGITPILSMIRSLGQTPSLPWTLYYLTQSREATPFLEDLNAADWRDRVHVHHDRGDPAQSFDLWPVLEKPGRAHIYCCGPRGLMEAVRDMSGHWSPSKVHFESFTEGGSVQAGDAPFAVRLAHSGDVFEIPVGQTILGVLRGSGLDLASSCESGTCGTCRTRLIEGTADHRDMVLMTDEMDDNIMICVSRAKSAELVLDL